jgi:hypothetical protein
VRSSNVSEKRGAKLQIQGPNRVYNDKIFTTTNDKNPVSYIDEFSTLAVRLAVLFIILHVVGFRSSLSRSADRIPLGLAQTFRASHLIRVNTPAQPGVSYTYISGILLTLSLLKFSTPTLNGSLGFLKVLLTHLQ